MQEVCRFDNSKPRRTTVPDSGRDVDGESASVEAVRPRTKLPSFEVDDPADETSAEKKISFRIAPNETVTVPADVVSSRSGMNEQTNERNGAQSWGPWKQLRDPQQQRQLQDHIIKLIASVSAKAEEATESAAVADPQATTASRPTPEPTRTKRFKLTAENYMDVLQLHGNDLLPTFSEFDCPVCGVKVGLLEGVMLKQCLHHEICR